jgi:hypothetical protein
VIALEREPGRGGRPACRPVRRRAAPGSSGARAPNRGSGEHPRVAGTRRQASVLHGDRASRARPRTPARDAGRAARAAPRRRGRTMSGTRACSRRPWAPP